MTGHSDPVDLYSHLSDSELRARLRQRWCSDDVDWLVLNRDKWPATDAIAKWLRA